MLANYLLIALFAFLAGVAVQLLCERTASRKLRELTSHLQQMSGDLERAGHEIRAGFSPATPGWSDDLQPTVDEARKWLDEHPRAAR